MSSPRPSQSALMHDPRYRRLRRQIALALLLSPSMCVLPLLAWVARNSRIDWLIWGVWVLISLALIGVIVRAVRHIEALSASDNAQANGEQRSSGD